MQCSQRQSVNGPVDTMNEVRLEDRYDLSRSSVLLNGTQGLVRMLLEQHERDRLGGLRTAGLVTGYRGSPLGSIDFQLQRAQGALNAADILFQPALNEDLAATALWGSQMSELRGEGRYDGVFGLWYGKGPGVDRSGDALRHANMAGVSPHGGVLAAMGDDHTGESSTTLHQSDPAMINAYIPVLAPSGVQEVLDFGILGFAMSRLTGNWIGLKCVKETIESTASVNGSLDRLSIELPELDLPPGGLNIRIWDTPEEREARIIDYRRKAAELFGHANAMSRRIHGRAGARVGLMAAGKSWMDLLQAMRLIGLDLERAAEIGLSTFKVGMVWPMDSEAVTEFVHDMELLIIVEEKRKVIEGQLKDLLYNRAERPVIIGCKDEDGRHLLTEKYELAPPDIAMAIGGVLDRHGLGSEEMSRRMATLAGQGRGANIPDLLERKPYFCSGCPHNTSTKIPEGSRAYAGIGCHYMVQWMDRGTLGFTHMGGEGANWIGEAPFSTREHVFQNIGDGTYNHSGLMAIRAAAASGANMTFKILYNDAVAMTGGQANDGSLTPVQIASELEAMGVANIACVHDGKEPEFARQMPRSVAVHERAELDLVQERLRSCKGVSAIIYCQTCAAEKRRRRKRGRFPAINRRVFINPDICEGCGDCGIQSNCLSILPLDTEFGTKRIIDQSSCNMDLSCLDGFCPSFVSIEGARPRKQPVRTLEIPELPEVDLPSIGDTYNIVLAGVGGTGVITIGAVLAMAGHLDGLGVGMIEMAGLAQKGGAVVVHCRLAGSQEDIAAIRVARGEVDSIIGGDLVLAASTGVLDLCSGGRTRAVINNSRIVTGEFTRDPDYSFPADGLRQRIASAIGTGHSSFIDAIGMSREILGDSIYANMLLLGAAWQHGTIPVSRDSLHRAIEINGTSASMNVSAFELGRAIAAGHFPDSKVDTDGIRKPLDERIQIRIRHLTEYQGERLASEYREFVDRFQGTRLHEEVAVSYHRLLAIKDEYEVARLHLQTADRIRAKFDAGFRLTYHLAPPFLARKGRDGRPAKIRFGPWMGWLFALLSRWRSLRGSMLDPFRFNPERALQRKLRAQYRKDMRFLLDSGLAETTASAIELAALPQRIRGFGPVWLENYNDAMTRREELLREMDSNGAVT